MLLDLAEHRDDGFIPLKDIAERQDVSKQYLEQIVLLLNTSKILRASRGKQGGYMLAGDPSDYSVGHILRITESGLAPVACLDDEVNLCGRATFCKTLPMWIELGKVMNNFLDGITLQDLMDERWTGSGSGGGGGGGGKTKRKRQA
jgi:Rrf2 family protein